LRNVITLSCGRTSIAILGGYYKLNALNEKEHSSAKLYQSTSCIHLNAEILRRSSY
jgi:hypothetical protein